MSPFRFMRMARLDGLRGFVAGARAVESRPAAQALFAAGGHKVLPSGLRNVVKQAVERQASHALTSLPAVEHALETGTVGAVAVQGARAAARQLVRSIGAAAAGGALIDGAWALFGGLRRARAGQLTPRELAIYVAREASTGAAATAAGTAAAAALVALTGGVATPAVFVVAAAASLGAKAAIDRYAPSEIRPESLPRPRLDL